MSVSSSSVCATVYLGVDAQLGRHAHKVDYFTLKYSQYPLGNLNSKEFPLYKPFRDRKMKIK